MSLLVLWRIFGVFLFSFAQARYAESPLINPPSSYSFIIFVRTFSAVVNACSTPSCIRAMMYNARKLSQQQASFECLAILRACMGQAPEQRGGRAQEACQVYLDLVPGIHHLLHGLVDRLHLRKTEEPLCQPPVRG